MRLEMTGRSSSATICGLSDEHGASVTKAVLCDLSWPLD